MNARKLILPTLITLCTLAELLALSAAPVQADVTHAFLSRITEVPAEGPHKEAVPRPGLFYLVGGMAVESGHLWVTGPILGPHSEYGYGLEEFDASTNEFEAQILGEAESVAVRNETLGLPETELYAGGRGGEVYVFGPSGSLQSTWEGEDTPAGSFLGQVQVAVDNNSTSMADWAAGDVYVAVAVAEGSRADGNVVDVFKPSVDGGKEYVGRLPGPEPEGYFPINYQRSVAVDEANGDVVVAEGGEGEPGVVYVFEPTTPGEYALVRKLMGTPEGAFEAGKHLAVAVDGGTGEGAGDIYVGVKERGVVYQFGSGGEYQGKLKSTSAVPFELSSLTVDSATHDLYIGSTSGLGVVIYGPPLIVPDVTTAPVSHLKPKSVTLSGTVDPDDGGAATCEFVWGTSEAFGKVVPCEANVANGNAPVEVHAQLEELQPDTVYYYRLQATNSANSGTNEGEAGQDQHFTTPGPGVEESVSDVASTSVTLDAEIEPNDAPTSYYFEYGTTAAYGSDVPLAPGVMVGSGKGVVGVSQHVQGLASSSVYHYRVVAVSEISIEVSPGKFETKVETFEGPDQTFTTQAVGTELELPDDRAWEMVSPPDKEGALILAVGQYASSGGSVIQAAADGDAMTYVTSAPSEAEPQGAANYSQDLSLRGPGGGWSTRDIAPANAREIGTGASIGNGEDYRRFSSDLSLAVVQPFGDFTPLSPEASAQTAYLHTNLVGGNVEDPCVSGCYRPLVTGAPGYADVPPGTSFGPGLGERCVVKCGPIFVGATPDLSHILLESGGLTKTQWATGECGCEIQLYEWSAVKPPSEELRPAYQLPAGEGGDGVTGRFENAALADDGSVFFFYHDHLYLNDVGKGESVRLDVARGVVEPGAGGAGGFLDASGDGSRVIFSDSKQLTKAAGGGIYECRVVEVAGVLGCGELELTGLAGGRLIGGTEDLSVLYFVGAGGELDIDRYNGSGWAQTPVGALSIERAWQVSPNGQWLAFMSNKDLTGYSMRDALSGAPDEEVYLYDASTGHLACASCDPTGALPVGEDVRESEGAGLAAGYVGQLGENVWLAGSIPGQSEYQSVSGRQSYVSDSGRLFFNSYGPLVPQDVNGTWDAYEYEPPGVGDCTTSSATFGERSGGCVGLISSGTSVEESSFLDAGEDGSDVFFLTTAQLAPQDRDSAPDIYDAHECTEQSPCPAITPSPPPCTTGDACKPAPTPQPTLFGAPSSETFSGAGNVTPATGPAVTPKSSARARKLVKALKACGRKPKKKRAACERKARRAYGSASRTKKSRKGGR